MIVKHVMSQIIQLHADEPLADGPTVPGAKRDFIVVKLVTSDAIDGIGVTFFGGALTRALKQAVDDLGALVIGEAPHRPERIASKLRSAADMAGPSGIFMLALSALDMALWDIKGKSLGVSLSRLLGGHRETVPAYASGALMRQFSLSGVETAAGRLVERGWNSMKTQLALPGQTSPEIEVDRIRVIREVIGPQTQLMCDINQRWEVHDALSIGARLQAHNLHWLEDITRADDYQGLAHVRNGLTTPIAAGEYVWGIEPFRQLLAQGSIDIAMIDLVRVGGITQWMKVAGMAEAFNIPVVSHLIPEVHVHLIAAVPNGEIVEYMPWTRDLFDNPPMPENSQYAVPAGPGLGLTFKREIEMGFKRG